METRRRMSKGEGPSSLKESQRLINNDSPIRIETFEM
jgi:hypothetical protein